MTKKNNTSTKESTVKKSVSSTTTKVKKISDSSTTTKGPMKDRILLAIASQMALQGNTSDGVEKTLAMSAVGSTNQHSFDTICSALKKSGLIGKVGTLLTLTEAGIEAVGGADAIKPPENNGEAQAMLREKLKAGKAKQMFDKLADGNAYKREDLAKEVGMDATSKSFGTYISSLSKMVDKVDGGKIRLKDVAFPCGRPCDKK
jgi:hypothetical protein